MPTLPPISVPSVRFTNRPTVALQTFENTRIQEIVLGIFRRFDYIGMDLESLIYFTLQSFHVTPVTFEAMHRAVRAHIMANFAIQQGKLARLSEVNMRRLIVCYTIEKQEE